MRIIEPNQYALALLVSKGSIKADKDSPGKHRLRSYFETIYIYVGYIRQAFLWNLFGIEASPFKTPWANSHH